VVYQYRRLIDLSQTLRHIACENSRSFIPTGTRRSSKFDRYSRRPAWCRFLFHQIVGESDPFISGS